MDSSMDLKSMTLEELTDCVMELGEKKCSGQSRFMDGFIKNS